MADIHADYYITYVGPANNKGERPVGEVALFERDARQAN